MNLKHGFRIASLVVPSWLAWYVACTVTHRGQLAVVVSYALGPLWIAVAGAAVLRALVVIAGRKRDGSTPILASIDVLTSAGVALAWTSAFGVIGAIVLGYASLAVVGLLGTGLFHAVVLYAFFALRSRDPMRSEAVTRSFFPAVLTEGEDTVEKIHVAGARIPLGFRLFVSGRVGPRWAQSRHVLEPTDSGADVVLESDIGPAVRGEHDAEPLVVWLEDTFGLCRSRRVEIARARVTVVPRVRSVDKSVKLLDRGQGPRTAKAARRLPTEGAFDLKEYKEGDDVRRIHWVRSLAAGQLIVRMPDEIPPDRPRVRVVLDTFFPEVFAMQADTATPGEVLDSLVGVWLAVARSLAEQGVQVTLVAAVPTADGPARVITQDVMVRSPHVAQRFGAQIGWQNQLSANMVLTDEATFVVSRTLLAPPPDDPKFKWIIVTPPVPTELAWPFASSARHLHPIGSSENRLSVRKRITERFSRARADHARVMLASGQRLIAPPPGSFTAGTASDGTIQLRAIQ
jgi:uncharacterized protein (DUF58 family)